MLHRPFHLCLLLVRQVSGNMLEAFAGLPWTREDPWPEAVLRETMFYLRRSKLVEIPDEVKRLIPRCHEEMAEQFHP